MTGPVSGSGTEEPPPADLRMPALAAAAWSGGLAGFLLPHWLVAVLLAGCGLGVLRRHRGGRPVVTILACLAACTAVAAVTVVRAEANQRSAVGRLAQERAFVRVTAKVATDPVLRRGRHAPFVLTRLTVLEVRRRGGVVSTRVPVLAIGDASWRSLRMGARITAGGLLGPADGPDLAAVLSSRQPPVVVGPATPLLDAAGTVRAAIRAAVAPAGADERALVPALVVGDDTRMSDRVVADFRTCGLTHLAAVSGTNLTLVVGFLLVLARWGGIRARGLLVVGAVGVAGFVLLARPEPSVLRAAAMGSVALVAMGSNGRERGSRALGVAVFGLLLFDPWLAVSLGFVLSTLATAGILFLAPPVRDALGAWLPRWVAEAVAVPFAAQLACTPVIAAISGQVSLVAVLANLLVAPAVGPATVLGLAGGLMFLVAHPLGLVCGWLAGWSAWWVVQVATRLAGLPTAAVGWPAGWPEIVLLTVVCGVIAVASTHVLARRRWSLGLCLVLVLVMVRPVPTFGWPPPGWVLVACDVGQGDGLVLNAGSGRGVVVDTGPDPRLMDRCLHRLGVGRVPVVVLTHFHADHVDGLDAVLAGRSVGEIDVTATREPPYGAEEVDRWAAAAGVPVRVPALGEVRRVGELTWQVIGPVRPVTESGTAEEGSVANDSSLVLLVQVRGIRILMSGDMEPQAQALVDRAFPALHVDVLKVPHHGSRYQDPDLLTGLGARLAVVSVGAHNDYGHPAAATLGMLRRAGMLVRRTDTDGDVAVVVRDGRLEVRTRGG